MKNKILILSFSLIVIFYKSQSASAYSYFGIGVMDNVDNARNLSLGGTGIATTSESNINFKNPATNISFSQGQVILDVGGILKYNTITSNGNKDRRFISNYNNLGMGFRITPKTSFAISVQPTSTTDYKIKSTIPVEGSTVEYPIYFEGSGGISNLSLNLAYKINKEFSIGGKVKNHFGSIYRTENIDIGSSTLLDVKIEKQERYTGFGSQLGLLYNKTLKDKLSTLSIGATYDFKTKLVGNGNVKETHNQNQETVRDESYSIKDTYLPQEIGTGINYLHKNKWMLTLDYQNKNWQGIKYDNTSEKYYNQNIVALGFEILPEKRIFEKVSDGFSYRFGFNYDTGYYKISSVKIDKLEGSLGLGIPLKSGLVLNLGYSYGIRGMSSALIKENYHALNISINFNNRWFQKNYYQ